MSLAHLIHGLQCSVQQCDIIDQVRIGRNNEVVSTTILLKLANTTTKGCLKDRSVPLTTKDIHTDHEQL